MTDLLQANIARAREEFLSVVGGLRPELHRYCSRLTGSVIEGEDIVQEALARAFYTLSLNPETPPLRPWLFKIAHNAALDLLKSHGHKYTEPREDISELAGSHEEADPALVRAALSRFLVLPIRQRSAVILKDVLGHSLEETAETMGTSVLAVKAALVRGREKLSESVEEKSLQDKTIRAELSRYVSLFNQRDWDGLRALIGNDCRLDLVAKSQRRGKEVGMYFGRYAKESVSLQIILLEGRPALSAHVGGEAAPSYFILLDWEDARVAFIRDYRYVPYIAQEAEYERLDLGA